MDNTDGLRFGWICNGSIFQFFIRLFNLFYSLLILCTIFQTEAHQIMITDICKINH